MLSECLNVFSYNEIEYFVYINLLILSLLLFYMMLFMIIYSSSLILNSVFYNDVFIEVFMTFISFIYIILIISPGLLLFLDYDFISSLINFNVYILGYQWAWNYNILFNNLSYSFDQLILSSSSLSYSIGFSHSSSYYSFFIAHSPYFYTITSLYFIAHSQLIQYSSFIIIGSLQFLFSLISPPFFNIFTLSYYLFLLDYHTIGFHQTISTFFKFTSLPFCLFKYYCYGFSFSDFIPLSLIPLAMNYVVIIFPLSLGFLYFNFYSPFLQWYMPLFKIPCFGGYFLFNAFSIYDCLIRSSWQLLLWISCCLQSSLSMFLSVSSSSSYILTLSCIHYGSLLRSCFPLISIPIIPLVVSSLFYSSYYLTLFSSYLILSLYSTISIYVYSFDVIHSFGYHSLGFKSDAIPGRVNLVSSLSLLFNGYFISYCYELCGAAHTSMLSSIISLSFLQFNSMHHDLCGYSIFNHSSFLHSFNLCVQLHNLFSSCAGLTVLFLASYLQFFSIYLHTIFTLFYYILYIPFLILFIFFLLFIYTFYTFSIIQCSTLYTQYFYFNFLSGLFFLIFLIFYLHF